MNREMAFVRELAMQADTFYSESEGFGRWAARALPGKRAQITGLESIANSSLKISDVLDYLKKQTAKAKAGKEWRQQDKAHKELGHQLITFIRDDLRVKRDAVCNSVGDSTGQGASEFEKQQVFLALIREFVRQVAAQYELGVSGHDG
ncbi:MAG TPA: hypothetical protein VFB82_20715 [Blastocatellia bacterium]|nr:hypothetical protein [Blastocatellia bacterium]